MRYNLRLRIGVHTSIAKSLEDAVIVAAKAGANTFQIFSASPRTWRAVARTASEVKLLQRARERLDLYPLVIHDNYLINLASCNESLRAQSTAAFRGEIERALAIGAEYLVAHPGNCKGHSVEEGIYSVIRSLAEAAQGLRLASVKNGALAWPTGARQTFPLEFAHFRKMTSLPNSI